MASGSSSPHPIKGKRGGINLEREEGGAGLSLAIEKKGKGLQLGKEKTSKAGSMS